MSLPRGIYVPTLTFFSADEDQTLDLPSHKKHILWMAQGGVKGFLVQGSTAEAVALTPSERVEIIRATRTVLDENGFKDVRVIAGAGAQSTREAISLSKDAKEAGADHVIVLPPSYFASSITKTALEAYYTEAADKSPLPVLIYSYPGASGGIDISSESMATLAVHPNIAGVKQTDHNIGKMTRVVSQTSSSNSFAVLGGASDYLLAALAIGASGTITGIANVTPRVTVRLFDLFEAGKLDEAKELQGKLSEAEWPILEGGIPSVKAAVNIFLGRGGVPRRPIPPSPSATTDKLKKLVGPLFELEQSLEQAK